MLFHGTCGFTRALVVLAAIGWVYLCIWYYVNANGYPVGSWSFKSLCFIQALFYWLIESHFLTRHRVSDITEPRQRENNRQTSLK